jgi:DNA-binding NarL/FixJ family response regulator
MDVAESGVGGLAAARDRAPDLVILDVMMPGLDALASSRKVFNTVGRWQLHHRSALKFGLGFDAVGLGLLLLFTL